MKRQWDLWFSSNMRQEWILRVGCVALCFGLVVPDPADAATFNVGPGMPYSTPSAVAKVAMHGDVVQIESGEYHGDVAIWRQNNLILRGVGGRPRLVAAGKSAGGKAIWVVKGDNVTIENIEFEGAKVQDRNGAGIRAEGPYLTVANCVFQNNENGILTSNGASNELVVENSVFDNNGYGDGRSHNIYVGKIRRFVLRGSYLHHAQVGHQVKSRAATNQIEYNFMADYVDGNSSYIIEFPNAGVAYVVGNILQQGPNAENSGMLSYGAEHNKKAHEAKQLYVVNNTFVNDRGAGTFVDVRIDGVEAKVVNNIFAGKGKLRVKGEIHSNLMDTDPNFANRKEFYYRLQSGSKAIDFGAYPGSANGVPLAPKLEYQHKAMTRPRLTIRALDVGAYEFGRAK